MFRNTRPFIHGHRYHNTVYNLHLNEVYRNGQALQSRGTQHIIAYFESSDLRQSVTWEDSFQKMS